MTGFGPMLRTPVALRTALALVSLALALLLPRSAHAQRETRFSIVSTADSTFAFSTGASGWVRAGTEGIVVDGTRRDALIARFRVLSVSGSTATALVTGATTRVTPSYTALINTPAPRWYLEPRFLTGAGAGLVLGLLLGSI